MFGHNQQLLLNMATPGSATQNVKEAQPALCTPGNLLLLGFSNFEEFNGVDLLSFVKEHNATLNFPQKVSAVRPSELLIHLVLYGTNESHFPIVDVDAYSPRERGCEGGK